MRYQRDILGHLVFESEEFPVIRCPARRRNLDDPDVVEGHFAGIEIRIGPDHGEFRVADGIGAGRTNYGFRLEVFFLFCSAALSTTARPILTITKPKTIILGSSTGVEVSELAASSESETLAG